MIRRYTQELTQTSATHFRAGLAATEASLIVVLRGGLATTVDAIEASLLASIVNFRAGFTAMDASLTLILRLIRSNRSCHSSFSFGIILALRAGPATLGRIFVAAEKGPGLRASHIR